MINKIICTLMAATFTLSGFAQRTDGSTASLVKAEQEFAAKAAKDGVKSAFNAYIANGALVFRPNPVDAKTFYATQPDDKNLSWAPDYAQVSRSGDWGYTSGGFTVDGEKKAYGEYLSVWKSVNGRWELVIDLGAEHHKPLKQVATHFVEPKDYFKPKFGGPKQIAAGKDIILTTEKTLNATLKSYGVAAYGGFLNPDARVVFPGYEPVIGKDKIIAFYNSMVSKMSLRTVGADKASGGDLAYTYGVATIDYRTDLRESFNYVFIYERQPDYNWNLIQQVFVPAER
ncbi:cysteinyl-tRNA synthetase [Pedobacter lusitanus]|uniref:Cysteinyl-tRNA synthetase n=1 Tax=Pedobacter lusitanus TaxID=1503925 RepID=A0A0D0GFY1_9SPHI|nr:nuclear transport factor 2 family protein [Pedobacter lusitanus]KIO75050.1 cysteinyl-tRNA synthetase [Pedobacter lusitanus]